MVEALLDRLAKERALDDGRLARRHAESRLRGHGLGQNRIRQELGRRGVPREVAEAGVRAALADQPEAEIVDTLARRYWAQRSARPKDDPATRLRRLWAFLVRRGFPPALVGERLRRLWPRGADGLEGLEPPPEGGD